MPRRWLLAAVIAALSVLELRVAAQKQGQIFVSLTAPDGTPVTDLQAGDVGVTEDGVSCKIVKVEPVEWPTKLQVLVDNNRINTEPINSLRDGLKSLFEHLPDGVEVSIYTTAGTPRLVVKPTTDKQKLIDGIGLIAPDGAAGTFFDALAEAATRVDRDKNPSFATILMVGSTVGRLNPNDRDYMKLQDILIKRPITVHIIVMTAASGGASGGGQEQTEIGIQVTKLSHGRYESINSVQRLATLLPEFGTKIGDSIRRQAHQFRVTYERPATGNERPRISASVRRPGTFSLSLDGRVP